ncbi:FAD-binding oxidoreductase [Thalassoroseus pseudoceratinae]|uniref:FAD-binding oxidoreductase n=1 Tax=Thalassoroseus pseudoceratinae TaxID=2713176 RepID=UPI00141D9AE2|nr:FAD-linked oxidase C-terminal domain-containing protein [Thalassoroseus pseudoceratinae]
MTSISSHRQFVSPVSKAERALLRDQLEQWIVRGRVLTAPAQLAGYDTDGLGYRIYRPDAVVIPADAEELTQLLENADQIGLPICFRGAGTSLSGGPVAAQGGVVVHLSAFRKIREIDVENAWCEVECGVTLNQLERALAPLGMFYPPDPSSGPVCTIGGNVAMNAGGAHCFRYGVTSQYILGVEAILGDGSVHRFGGPAGGRGAWREDWKRLMVGSEGTLAVFTRFWLRLLPCPKKVWTFRATFPDLETAERAIHRLSADESCPVAIELMDPRCVAMVENSPMAVGLPTDAFLILTEIDGLEALVNTRVDSIVDILKESGSDNVAYSDDPKERQRLWKARKVAGGLMGQISADFLVQDAVIPKRSLADVLELVYRESDAAGIPVVNVFHAGDGNLHPNFLFDSKTPGELEKVEQISKRLMKRVIEIDGTLSGEHGIGNDKTAYMPLVFGPDMMRLQLAVSKTFDSHSQLNPLKVFANRRFGESTIKCDSPDEIPQRDHRCFSHFLDPIDGILCVSVDAVVADVQDLAAPHRLRFPLGFDGMNSSLRTQTASTGYASASSRFGPYFDNIVGMNWKLPSGRVVRIGERVVKSTTGYDLLRFLLNAWHVWGDGPTKCPWGEPVDYVLRLRPDCEQTRTIVLTGDRPALHAAANRFRMSCWSHWFDSIDCVQSSFATTDFLRVAVNCSQRDWPVFEAAIRSIAQEWSLSFEVHDEQQINDDCPDFVVKTTPQHALKLAEKITQNFETATCVVLCANGVVHNYFDGLTPEKLTNSLRDLATFVEPSLQLVGGDWSSRHLSPDAPGPVEQSWLETLEREFSI